MSNLQKNVRVLHRYLGGFVLGLTLIYVVSGVVLVFRDQSLFTFQEWERKQLEPGLSASQLAEQAKLRRFQLIDTSESEITFKGGNYQIDTGELSIQRKKYPSLLDKMNHLHKITSDKTLSILALLYAISLAVLAFSSLFMFKPGSKLFRHYTRAVAGGLVLAIGVLVIL